jgi:hypothetical protein
MAAVSAEERTARAAHASAAAAASRTLRVDPLVQKYGAENVRITKAIMVSAKQRCTNPNAAGYKNYGGRGIQFAFPSIRAAVQWVLDNLGPRLGTRSIDRVDNDRHYEPGNLRWATRLEQARNRRAYTLRGAGARIRALRAQRQDLSYETLRQWVAAGLTDDEILGKIKHARTSL